MTTVSQVIAELTIGRAIQAGSLTVWPLFRETKNDRNYELFDQALTAETFEVSELGNGGMVAGVRAVNRGKQPVLLIDGDEFLGAKQNRVVNLTVLVPSGGALTVPVSCVERGRWSAEPSPVSSSPYSQFPSGRADRIASVTRSMAGRGDRSSDQSEVWSGIGRISGRLGVQSETEEMSAVFRSRAGEIEELVERAAPIDRQVGAVFALGTTLGIELYDSELTCRRHLPKVVRGFALEALTTPPGVASQAEEADRPLLLLRSVATAKATLYPAVGIGHDLRIRAEGLTGTALVWDDGLIHLTAYLR